MSSLVEGNREYFLYCKSGEIIHKWEKVKDDPSLQDLVDAVEDGVGNILRQGLKAYCNGCVDQCRARIIGPKEVAGEALRISTDML